MRTLRQPGPVTPSRRDAIAGAASGQFRLVLAPGFDLLHGIRDALLAHGVTDAAISLASGSLDRLSYMTGMADASGARVATYGAPTVLEGPVAVVAGNAFLGRDRSGQLGNGPIVHCHAVVVDRAGAIHGGHIVPGACLVGAEGVTLWVTALERAGFAAEYDAETNYPIFRPVALAARAGVKAAE
ncbi:MAG: DNA-binding protein [Alphaproteobacteria bacterium]|nr:DNA-binding protein [Alphaproteobacteria bacterium]